MKPEPQIASPRNLQLDFFRGLALMIIFVNHMPGNPWFHLTPSRLGPSDAAETFVFLSGFAAALAFGRSLSQAGIALGSLRVLQRCAQIYLAHLALFILMTCLYAATYSLDMPAAHAQFDSLDYFFDRTREAVVALISLRYVPNFIDILPMYLVILLWVPMFWALSRIHIALSMVFSIGLYLTARRLGWELPADPASGRVWFFNPFCWQLIFFTGFSMGSGWLPIPGRHRGLIWLCVLLALFCFPLENPLGYHYFPWFADLRLRWSPWLDKSHLGLFRYAHFLTIAYLVRVLTINRQHWLRTRLAYQVVAMGQQSLPIFILGTGLSFIGGLMLDGHNADLGVSGLINLAGMGLMILSARTLNWLDQKPWKLADRRSDTTISIAWPRQAAMALGLLVLSIAPLQLLQSEQDTAELAVAPSADLVITLPEDQPPKSEEASFQPKDNSLESSDTL